jgi:hypothetical protein
MRLLPKWLSRFSYLRRGATWRSGYATVCKTVYPGSIPGVASTRKSQCAPACCGIGGNAGLAFVPRIKSSAKLSTLSSFGSDGM